jgi:uncharacterized membrane protein YdjX (TVP38/TMEM64 family)
MRRFSAIAVGLLLIFSICYVAIASSGLLSAEALSRHLKPYLEASHNVWLTGPIVVLLLMIDLVLPIPSVAVMTFSGYFMGTIPGALFNVVGAMGAALLGFEICKRFGRRGFQRIIGADESDRVEDFFRTYGDWAIVLSRSVPMLTEIMSCLAGLSRMSYKRFLLLSAAGSIPISILYAWTGHHASGNPPVWWLVLLALGVPALGFAVVRSRGGGREAHRKIGTGQAAAERR